jgi:hypothetical protein
MHSIGTSEMEPATHKHRQAPAGQRAGYGPGPR